MTARPIAVVQAQQGYDGLHQAFRARAEELQVKRDDLNELAGLARGHVGKILAPYPTKAIGRTTLGPILYALKLKLIVVPDDDIVWDEEPGARNASYARCSKPVRAGTANMPEMRSIKRKVTKDMFAKNGRKGGRKSGEARRKRGARVPKWKRRVIARNAARQRWRKEREARRAARNAPGETVPA